MATKQLNIRVPEDEIERWRRQAEREDRTMQAFICRAVRLYLNSQRRQKISKPPA